MLVLSRKVDQTIVIQDNITIKILEINGDRVKLGISAPRNVVILRQELTEEIKQENLEAVVGSTPGGARPSLPALKKAPVRP